MAGLPNISGKKVLFIIAQQNFRDEELFEPKAVLEAAGASTTIASKKAGSATGMLGGKANASLALSDVSPGDFDAIIFVGGGGSSVFFNDPAAHDLAKEAAAQGKILGAICIAPSILANAGLLRGKKATAFSSEAQNLRDNGAGYTGQPVTVDGKIITGSGPAAAKEFGKKIAEALAE
ncbi:MAG: DJ-1/PfpI family protein [Candidatus Diapherotrites archaeon]|nr:DJ-1/PfpI family protein [Candidatus Diapherotrites archaeon]